jgi:nitrate reductase NapE component
MTPNLPPPNRAIGWYRFMLWVMPTCVAITSAFGLEWLSNHLIFFRGDRLLVVWWVFNIAAAIGIGIFEVKLNRPLPGQQEVRLDPAKVVKFVVLQFVIVPVLSCVIAFGFCAIAGMG